MQFIKRILDTFFDQKLMWNTHMHTILYLVRTANEGVADYMWKNRHQLRNDPLMIVCMVTEETTSRGEEIPNFLNLRFANHLQLVFKYELTLVGPWKPHLLELWVFKWMYVTRHRGHPLTARKYRDGSKIRAGAF